MKDIEITVNKCMGHSGLKYSANITWRVFQKAVSKILNNGKITKQVE